MSEGASVQPSPLRLERLRLLSQALVKAQQPIRILRTLHWTEEVRLEFFASGARELPRPRYELHPDLPLAITNLNELIAACDLQDPAEVWLHKTATSFRDAGRMLLAVGTRRFHEISKLLYGYPASRTHDPQLTHLDLAHHVQKFVDGYRGHELGAPPAAVISAQAVATELKERFDRFFGELSPKVKVVPHLSARAVAGADVVRIRDRTGFGAAELTRLEHHEGYVHVATTLNGKSQPALDALGIASPRVTAVQEGLATFAELQSQSLDLDRLEILADRVVGIQMAMDGADFIDLYVYFLEHSDTPEDAYEAARRVMRGGPTSGNAPFTKDVTYLEGLLLIFNFLQAALLRHRPELLRLLFVGKIHTDDLPLLLQLEHEGLVVAPRFLPAWARDLRFLAAQMGFSSFLNRTDAKAWIDYCDQLFAAAR
jgi:uncharacterized protein (TIGR02421 family)